MSTLCNAGSSERSDHPVNCVSFDQASAYCAWRGLRLPTEEEWEFAARGTDGRRYPWGVEPPGGQLCWNGPNSDLGDLNRFGTCPRESFPADRSPFGVFDMAGNVMEWTNSPFHRADDEAPSTSKKEEAPSEVFRYKPARRKKVDDPELALRGGVSSSDNEADVTTMHRSPMHPRLAVPWVGVRCAGQPR
jgi:formylglycine-generating enzyme required for sulfatase activity